MHRFEIVIRERQRSAIEKGANVAKESYLQNVLEGRVLSLARNSFGASPRIFQYGGAPDHSARQVQP